MGQELEDFGELRSVFWFHYSATLYHVPDGVIWDRPWRPAKFQPVESGTLDDPGVLAMKRLATGEYLSVY